MENKIYSSIKFLVTKLTRGMYNVVKLLLQNIGQTYLEVKLMENYVLSSPREMQIKPALRFHFTPANPRD